MGQWIPYSGAPVITSVTTSWQTLDLSSIVGVQTAVVVLRVENGRALIARPHSSTHDSGPPGIWGGRGSSMGSSGSSRRFLLLNYTDTLGRMEYRSQTGGGWTGDVNLLGYFIPDYFAKTPFSSAITTSWAEYTIGSMARPPAGKRALVGLETDTSLSDTSIAYRPADMSGDGWAAFSGLTLNGANGALTFNSGIRGYPMVCDVGDDGVVDAKASGTTGTITQDTTWTEHSYYLRLGDTLWTAQSLDYYDTVGWTTVDLSPYVGAAEALVFLRVTVDSGGIEASAAARPYGATGDHISVSNHIYGAGAQQAGGDPGHGGVICCPTDSAGRIEMAADRAGATFDLQLLGMVHQWTAQPLIIPAGSVSPIGSVVSLAPPDGLRLRIEDPVGFGFLASTITVTATDQISRSVPLIESGVMAPGVSGYIAGDGAGTGGAHIGADIVIDWPSTLLTGQRYTVSVDAEGILGGTL